MYKNNRYFVLNLKVVAYLLTSEIHSEFPRTQTRNYYYTKPLATSSKVSMKLKKAVISDIIDLRKICIDAYSLNFHSHWNDGGLEWYLDKEFSTERLTSDLTDKNTEYYFIEHSLKVVGFIKIRNNSIANSPIENSVELEKIYVLPECKGIGIGKLALMDIVKMTEMREKKNLFLCVIDTNQNAIAFYEKLGFKFHSKTILDIPYFKEELKGMNRMVKELNG